MDWNTIEKINKCISDIKHGDDEAVTRLHKFMGNHLKFIALKFLKNETEAEDLIQDFWLDIKKYCEKNWYSANGFNYLTKIFQNLARMRLRQLHRRKEPLSLKEIQEFENPKTDFNYTERQIALRSSFERGMALMSEPERMVFSFVCYEDMTIRQIAKELHMPKTNIGKLRQQAMNILTQVLIEDGWDKDV